MSNDNLILFPKKSTSNISMNESEAKWMISGSLLVVLTMAIGINSTLFSQTNGASGGAVAVVESPLGGRSVASINPLFRVSWEKRAFEVLKDTDTRDLANVGGHPSVFDRFAFGTLEGHYAIRKVEGKIAEIRLADYPESQPKTLLERKGFLVKNLALFSDQAHSVEEIHAENNSERLIEKFQLKGQNGQDLGVVQMLLDKNQNLLSMTVQ